MTHYFRVGNTTVTQAQLSTLTPTDVSKINEDAKRAEDMRQNNLADSMGLKRANTLNMVADVRPGSELRKALLDDLAAKNEAEAVVKISASENTQPSVEKKKRGRPAGSGKKKVEAAPQEQTQQ